jgi:hypothetical protein
MTVSGAATVNSERESLIREAGPAGKRANNGVLENTLD